MTDAASHLMVRPLQPADLPALQVLIGDAFGPEEGPSVVQLTTDLLSDPTAEPRLALVAEQEQRPVGVVLFTAAVVAGHAQLRAAILAPLAVAPDRQRRGVGTALIAAGLQQLQAAGCDLVFVYGSPRYYGRAGFSAQHRVTVPLPLWHPPGWQALALRPGALDGVAGEIRGAQSLMRPEYW